MLLVQTQQLKESVRVDRKTYKKQRNRQNKTQICVIYKKLKCKYKHRLKGRKYTTC